MTTDNQCEEQENRDQRDDPATAPNSPVTENRSGPTGSGPTGSGPTKETDEAVGEPGEPTGGCCVVGIGASAGGLQALNALFDQVPADTGMAYVIVQHLDPHHETLLPELLEKRTDMQVRLASEGMKIDPNVVYVIPPDVLLTLTDGVLHTDRFEQPRGHRTPIDAFLRSLAHDRRENAIAVILSGNGSDGTLGVKEIKELGGMVMAQDPTSADYGSMPYSAIQTGLVDFVLPPEKMAGKIRNYDPSKLMLRREAEERNSAVIDHIDSIIALLRRVTGHDFKGYKRSTLARRIQRRIHMLHVAGVREYVEMLQKDPTEAENLFRDFLISVTHFFRDAEAFHTLALDVIPALVRESEEEGFDAIRVWVPGCATGEEAYSIGMLLMDYCEKNRIGKEIKIFATDIDPDALEVARRGSYPEGIVDQVPEDFLDRYFMRQGHQFRVRKPLRDAIIFSPHNLVKDPPFSRLDLISCRNLLIYLESEEQQRLMRVLHYALRSQGFLFLGSSENVAARSNLFRTISKKHRIFRQKETVIGPPTPSALGASRTLYQPYVPSRTQPATDREAGSGRQIIERIVLREYAPTYVVVDETRQILFSSGETSRYLALPEGNISTNVIDMARRGLRLDLRSALHEAFRTTTTVVKGSIPLEISDGETARVRMTVRPISEVSDEEVMMLILFEEEDPPASKKEQEEAALIGDDHPAVVELEEELRSTREQLQTTIEELETTNEELKSSNEELLSMNEELQSSNEELQTSKEEIQSINEELYTVNAELNQKIEELNHANSDLQNLLQSTHIPTIFVGADREIKRFTLEATELFSLVDNDVGRQITDIRAKFDDGDLQSDIAEVLATLRPKEREVTIHESENVFVMRILPYRTVNNVIDGVVLTFSDITFVRRAEEGERYLKAMFEYVPEGIMVVDAASVTTQFISREGYRMLGRDARHYDEPLGERESSGTTLREDGETEYTYPELPIIRALQEGEIVRNERLYFIGSDGRRLPLICTAAPILDEQGNIVAAVATWRDISEIEEIQEELRRSNDNYRAITSELESLYRYMPIGLSVLDEDLCYVRINQYLADVHGRAIEDHLGKNPFELLPELRERVEPIVQRVLETGEPAIDLEFSTPSLAGAEAIEKEDDQLAYWNASYFRMTSAEGEKTYVVSIVQDITKKREAQMALEESRHQLSGLNEELEERVERRTEQVRSLSAALAMAERSERRRLSFLLHDDLQQILFGIEMKLQILQKRLSSDDGEVDAQEMQQQLDDLDETLLQAIQVTRTLSVELNPPLEHDSSVEAALRWIIQHMETQHGLQVELNVDEDVRMPNVDMRALMVQLVRELLFNVVKHSGAMHARLVAEETAQECLAITVEDDGRGFDSSELSQQKAGGLGLYSIRERVSLVGGAMDISSKPGKGTSITVTMPASL